MNTETVLGHILPAVQTILKEVVSQAMAAEASSTLYDLEAQTQAALPRIGQAVLQGLVKGQGSGIEGPERRCPCGQSQRYHDRARPVTLQTSVGDIRLSERAYSHCPTCGANHYPLDARLGLGQAGRMSRYLQEQCGWLLALLPARMAQQTLVRFGWPPVAVSQIRAHGEALGAELEQETQERLALARQEAAGEASKPAPLRQAACGERLYAAPDGVMYCTTERDGQTGKVRWRELKVAAVYETSAAREPEACPAPAAGGGQSAAQEPVRTRVARWLREQDPAVLVAPADQAIRVTYVAETGPWEQFGPRLWGELWERGLGRPHGNLVVVADGSDHIDHVVDSELRVPGVHLTRILDIAHAQQHLWAVSHAAFGEGRAEGAAWVQAPLTALERGQVGEVLNHLEALASAREEQMPEVAESARKAAGYFRQRQTQVDYPHFVAAGYQIGSGLAESACKRFGTDRMKGAGMRWTIPGAQAVATLRAFLLSERWIEVTAHCQQAA
jgi:hypothetical protein